MADTILHIDRPFDESVVRSVVGSDVILLGPDDPVETAHAAIVGAATWDARRFDTAPSLRVLARTGIGVDAVDLAEATRRGILVTNTPDGPTVSTAEHTIALLLAVAKTLPHHQQMLRDASGTRLRTYTADSRAVELDGLTLGLVAYGRIGRRVATMAAAVGMRVVAHDPFLTPDAVADDPAGVELVGFDELLAESDVISLHCPLTEESRRLFRAETFARCKPGVIFVNAARGGLVDHDDLLAALDSGQVMAAGLDVTDPEPLSAGASAAASSGRDRDPARRLVDGGRTPPHAGHGARTGDAALDGPGPTHLVNPDVLH